MHLRKLSGLFYLAATFALTLLSGCGSSGNTTIPSTVTVFYSHSAIFRNSTTLFTSGYNGFGQLGIGNLNDQQVFQRVRFANGPATGVAVGADHTLAFGKLAFGNSSSVVYAWGSNYHGQIGNGVTTTGTGAFSQTPIRVPVQGNVTRVAAGAFHSLALLQNGQVASWGFNGYGQLGHHALTDQSIPDLVLAVPNGAALNNITEIAAGGGHSLALTADGTVYAWGNNASGQVGVNPAQVGNLSVETPTLVSDANGTLQNIKQIAAGGSFSIALQNASAPQTLYFWGNEIGQPSSSTSTFTPKALTLPSGIGKIVRIAAGLDHILLLDDAGVIWAAGFNQYGQLGDGFPTNQSVLTDFPGAVPGPTTVNASGFVRVSLPAGLTGVDRSLTLLAIGHHSLALLSDGQWYGWGDNGNGQLGLPPSSSLAQYSVPTVVRGVGLSNP